ncbi:sigma-54-dependent transcriptional regulator [Coralliovum pocilloporae]|uniref:nitrogen assimilation response regulator NtrX n=1 Tax=Coralliovum pocilloporae TaxID=3066369 RepID=UPI003307B06C
MASDILIVDDEADIRELVSGILDDEGYSTRTAANSDAALRAINDRQPSLVFLDIWLQGSRMDGLEVLDAIHRDCPDLPVVVISGHGNIETAVSAIKRGAYDYIEKPFNADRLILIAERALETSHLKREVRELKERSSDIETEIIGSSSAINQLRTQISRLAPTNSRIMITGPSGSGKELVARTIHRLSDRKNGPFVAINSAAITPERMEHELFGVEGGPDGGRKTGALEEAHGGTLYLDEVADMPGETQSRILRVLTEQAFERVGGSTLVRVDVRIISSTARDLEAAIEEQTFREDLFHRLSVVPLRVPGLAERRDDIPDLINHYLEQISRNIGVPKRTLSDEVMLVLQAHDWPGNLRQLRNNVERLLILAQGDPDTELTTDMLPAEVGAMLPNMPGGSGGEMFLSLPLREAREVFEREYLSAQISRFSGNISKTASFIGMERSALHRKLKSLAITGS